MDDYLRVADVVVTKLGGMTTTECMTIGTPIIGIDPIPGQEEYNTQFILENKLGAIARTREDLLYYLSHIPAPAAYAKKQSAKIILATIAEAVK
jgi:processive 1,2-diacylglycerol beta-glucosyltransferase